MNYLLTIFLILFLKLYSFQNYDKKLYGVWNLIISKEYYSHNSSENNNNKTTYDIGDKVIEFKSDGSIIDYQDVESNKSKYIITKKNINISYENGSTTELNYFFVGDTLVIENYEGNKLLKKSYIKEKLNF